MLVRQSRVGRCLLIYNIKIDSISTYYLHLFLARLHHVCDFDVFYNFLGGPNSSPG